MTASIEQRQINLEIRDAVEYEVGSKEIKDFEIWAFKSSPARYDGDIAFRFEKTRSTKFDLPANNVEALARIIHIWKHRHDWKLGGT